MSHPIRGKVFVFSGSLATMTRSEARQTVEKLGGTVTHSIGTKAHYLVTGAAAGHAKTKDAEKQGTQIIGEAQWLQMVALAKENNFKVAAPPNP